MSEPTGTQYGGFWARLLAFLADSAVLFLVSATVLTGVVIVLRDLGLPTGPATVRA